MKNLVYALIISAMALGIQASPSAPIVANAAGNGYPIDIKSIANMGFADDVADDQTGGWTDQGPANDLRSMTDTKVVCAPVEFTIIDPKQNGGKSCLVLGGGGRPYFPKEIEVAGNNLYAGVLFLLHSIAWAPASGTEIGKIIVSYTDGTQSVHPVTSGIDVGDWWKCYPLENGLVAWNGQCDASATCLFMSEFRLNEKPLKSIMFRSTGKAVWMIVAATTFANPVDVKRDESFYFKGGIDWRFFDEGREIEVGSALDFSASLDAPAGKYGFIHVAGNTFQFETGNIPVRFFGTNLAYSANFPTHERASNLAERLARIGYNAVRIHHFDRELVRKDGKDSLDLDPEQFDKLDYLIAELKKRGIYVTLDLFTERRIRANEFKELPIPMVVREYKMAAMLSPEVKENFKSFSRTLLEHVNPYTNLRWADDPVFIGMSILNENTILHNISRVAQPIKDLYQKYFEEEAKSLGIAITPDNQEVEFRRFLIRVYNRYWEEMNELFQEIGVKIPLTDQNFVSAPGHTPLRERYDYVDNHLYWSHPVTIGNGIPPFQIANASALSRRLMVPKDLAPSRILGKPFTVTEYDFCYPDSFRAEGGPIFSAFAALQDWNAIYRFGYSHNWLNCFTTTNIEIFDSVNDPVRILSERFGFAFFLRGDVTPASPVYAVAVSNTPAEDFQERFPNDAQDLMFFGKVGSVISDGNNHFSPEIPKETAGLFSCDKRVASWGNLPHLGETVQCVNREICADFTTGLFSVATPRSEALVLPDRLSADLPFMTVKNLGKFAVYGAIAIDDKPLAESHRILFMQLTDVKEEDIKFASSRMDIILEYSKSHRRLARQGRANITLSLASSQNWKLYALALSGQRISEQPFTIAADGKLSFTADSFAIPGRVVFSWELVRE